MINRVVILGRVVSTPVHEVERGVCHLDLEVGNPCFPDGEVELTRLPVRVEGDRRAATVSRWLTTGRLLQVTGHLALREGALCVEVEDFNFMQDKLGTRYLDQEARTPAA